MTNLTPETLAELRRDAESWILIGGQRVLPLLNALDAAHTERDALAEWRDFSRAEIASLTDRLAHMTEARDNARAEVDRLSAVVAGRCLSDITHRDEGHRQSFCMLPADHAPLAHDDCMGCTWTDADHWRPQAVDRLADELRAIADDSQREGWDSPTARRVVERLTAALDGGERS